MSSLFASIVRASRDGWSGSLSLRLGGDRLGSVLLRDGRIAWAVSAERTEDLATFLWRAGNLTREQLSQVSTVFRQHKGKKRFASILEELGYMPLPVLRRCLVLHLKLALTSLFSYPEALVDPTPQQVDVDETFLFDLEEVLPISLTIGFVQDWVQRYGDDSDWQAKAAEDHLFRPLFEIPGYLATVVTAADGSVLLAHGRSDKAGPRVLGIFLASTFDHFATMSSALNMGAVTSTMIECDEGFLNATWLDESKQYMIAVAADRQANLGLMKSGLKRFSATLKQWMQQLQQQEVVEETGQQEEGA